MLDFDGTLSPITARHRRATLSPVARRALVRLTKQLPIAVISGRSLGDVRSRIRIAGISYAGSHGLEMRMARPHVHIAVTMPKETMQMFRAARANLSKIAKKYRGVSIEDKGKSYAIHYRRLSHKQAEAFVSEAGTVLAPYILSGKIRVINDLSTFDLVPHSGRTKGQCAREMYAALKRHKNAVPVYIGDGVTDEDAFAAFQRSGITIRVGRSRTSHAQYYFSSRSDVDNFLTKILTV
ncbi:MAG: trehalose-phosphatase [Candidatus Pacebacteria bacterium]|nr:trehalose-phosphatase [Candidatus Paceibacterota bacterium]